MSSDEKPPQIVPASRESLARTLDLVFRDHHAEERASRREAWLAEARPGAPGQGVLEAHRGSQVVGAIAWQLQEGRAALAWPPRVVPGEPVATLRQLSDAMLGQLAAAGVHVVHVLLEEVREEDDRVLRSAGFAPLAELLYLVSEEIHFPRTWPPGPVEFEAYAQDKDSRLAAIVEATYEGTLDCPALDGVREVGDVLAGYRSAGVFRPDLWTIVRHERRDVGCLLLGDHPEYGNLELVYMGLIPTARGRGWSIQIAQHAQWTAHRLGRSRLVVAVDSKNAPALSTYAATGFREFDRRMVYMGIVGSGQWAVGSEYDH